VNIGINDVPFSIIETGDQAWRIQFVKVVSSGYGNGGRRRVKLLPSNVLMDRAVIVDAIDSVA
jgi:hypothetical protein